MKNYLCLVQAQELISLGLDVKYSSMHFETSLLYQEPSYYSAAINMLNVEKYTHYTFTVADLIQYLLDEGYSMKSTPSVNRTVLIICTKEFVMWCSRDSEPVELLYEAVKFDLESKNLK